MAYMFPARRAITWTVILGLVIALAVILRPGSDSPAVDLVDDALQPIDDTGAAQQPAPAIARATDRAPASAPATGSDDETDSQCVQTLGELAEFAETERNAANPTPLSELTEDQLAELTAELESLPRSLAGSPDPELFLTGTLLDRPEFRVSDDPSAQATLLELGSRAADSDWPLLAWHALRACVEAEEYCPYTELEESLLEPQQDNADAWALAATLRYRRGDVAGALAAMQDAARASTSTWYWTETIALIERSTAEQTEMRYPYGAGNGFAAAGALPRDSALQMCREQSMTSRAWAEACLAFGTLRGDLNETMMARGLAYSIRRQALEALGETERAAEVAAEYALFHADVSAVGRMSNVRQALLNTSPEQFDAYVSAVHEFGESEGARVFFRQELPPLLERAGLLDRDGARECIAEFFEPPVPVGTRSATYRNYRIEEYPVRVGDQLLISVGGATSQRVGPDGTIRIGRVPNITAVGKTTGQLEREIATALSERRGTFGDVLVILISSPSPEDLRLEFDNALREAKERREEPR